jgi:hypothetical protein
LTIVEVPDYIQLPGRIGQVSALTSDKVFYESFVDALKVLGKPNVDLVLQALEGEDVIHDGMVDRERLEPVLRSIFGDGAKVFLEFAKSPRPTH